MGMLKRLSSGLRSLVRRLGGGGWEKLLTDAMIAAEYHGKQLAPDIGRQATDTWNHWRLSYAARQYADYSLNREEWLESMRAECREYMCLGAKDESWIMSHIVWALNAYAGELANSKRRNDTEATALVLRRIRCLLRHFQLCALPVKGIADKYPRVFSAHARSVKPGPGEPQPANQITYAGEALAWFSGKMKQLPQSLRRTIIAQKDPPRDYFWLALFVRLEAETNGWVRRACYLGLNDGDLLPTRTPFHRSVWRGGMQTWFDYGPDDCRGMLRPAFWCRVEYDPVTMKLTKEEYGTDGRWGKTQKAENCTGPFRIPISVPHDATDNGEYVNARPPQV